MFRTFYFILFTSATFSATVYRIPLYLSQTSSDNLLFSIKASECVGTRTRLGWLACLWTISMMTATCFIQSTTCPEAALDSGLFSATLTGKIGLNAPLRWISQCMIFEDKCKIFSIDRSPCSFQLKDWHTSMMLVLMLKMPRSFLLSFEFLDLLSACLPPYI